MKPKLLLRLLFLSFIPLTLPASGAEPGNAIRLFDGKTFQGWEGDTEKSFRIQDGSIVGGNLKERIPRNEFLCTTRPYSDFILELKFKVTGEETNAGIQIRSQRIPNHHEMIGYQADIGQSYWGALYDESRRRKILMGPDLAKLNPVLNKEGWNDYKIHAEGKRVRLWINGLKTVDYVEPDDSIEQSGYIALQIHSGPPGEVWYRDITLREIKPKE